jgi:subtilisin-like proprotein convertase family protein
VLTLLLAGPVHSQIVSIPSEPSSHGPIPDGLGAGPENYGEPRDIIFNVTGAGATVVDASISISANHSWVGDLRVTLIAPNGNPHTVFERTGATTAGGAGFGNDLSDANPITFSDAASQSWWTVAAAGSPISGALSVRTARPGGEGVVDPAPNTSFREFLRSNPANGTWILRFEDGWAGDTGDVVGANLELITAGAIREVTSVADSGAGTLRQAMLDANSGDMITFASPLFDSPQIILLETELPTILNEELAIQGPGADLLTLRRADDAPEFKILAVGSSDASLTISGMTLSNGVAEFNGGGISSRGDLTLSHVRISGNRANGAGGGMSLQGSSTLLSVTIDHNIAGGTGGGVSYVPARDGRLRLFNSTVASNRAGLNSGDIFGPDAGGIRLLVTSGSLPGSASVELTNSTIVGNSGAAGGVLISAFAPNTLADAKAILRNSILANNSPDNLATFVDSLMGNARAEFISAGFNLSNDFNGITTVPSDITADPRLGPLAQQGGSTPVHMPLGGSPAIDNGKRFGQVIDQRGQTKPLVNADIGAVEVQQLLVTNTDDSGTGSLRAALTAANANGPGLDDILFDPQVFSTPRAIFLQTPLPVIDSSLTINGPRADMLQVVRESGAPDMSIFETSFTPEIVALSGMLLTNGQGAEFGGGVHSLANLSLTGMHITGNSAGSGGGVSLAFADGIIRDSTIAFNTAGQSGGIQFESSSGNRLEIINSTISSNRANIFPAIFNSGTGTVFLVNSTVALNGEAGDSNGAITTTGDSEINLRNTILANNAPFNLEIIGPASSIRSHGFNLSDDTSSSVFLDQPGDLINVDAGLGPLFNFGGPTPVHALTVNSSALDAGNNDGSGVLRDQRGNGFDRSVDISVANMPGSDGTDIGAYEAPDSPPIAQYTPSEVDFDVPFNGLGIQTVEVENVGIGPLNVNVTAAALDCSTPAPWLSFSPGSINSIDPIRAVHTKQ